MIPADKMVTVPAQVLQDLIWNVGLIVAGMGAGEIVVERQCQTLQTCIDLDGAPEGISVDLNDPVIARTDEDNVTFLHFRR